MAGELVRAGSTSLSLSREKVVELAKKLEGAQRKLATVQGKGEKHAAEVVEAAEYFAAILALGYARGRYGAFDVKGIPAEVIGGLVAHVVGFSGFLGKHSGDIHNIGNASLGFALGLEAIEAGEKAREASKKPDAEPSMVDRARQIAEEAAATAAAAAIALERSKMQQAPVQQAPVQQTPRNGAPAALPQSGPMPATHQVIENPAQVVNR